MSQRKVLIICIDAGGHDYLAASEIPNIRKLAKAGFYKHVHSVIPSVTNVNNVSIATGTFPERHGITTNYHVDRETGKGEFIEDNRFLLAPTLFERAKMGGFAEKTALLVTKKKLLHCPFIEEKHERYPFGALIGATYPLTQIDAAFERAMQGDLIRVAVDPRRE